MKHNTIQLLLDIKLKIKQTLLLLIIKHKHKIRCIFIQQKLKHCRNMHRKNDNNDNNSTAVFAADMAIFNRRNFS